MTRDNFHDRRKTISLPDSQSLSQSVKHLIYPTPKALSRVLENCLFSTTKVESNPTPTNKSTVAVSTGNSEGNDHTLPENIRVSHHSLFLHRIMAIIEDDKSLDGTASHSSHKAPLALAITSTIDGSNLEDVNVVEQLRRLQVGESRKHNDTDKNSNDLEMKHSRTAAKNDSAHNGISDVASHRGAAAAAPFHNSCEFNDSCASFASFGGCSDDGSSLGDSYADLAEQRAAFTKLDSELPRRPPPPQRRTSSSFRAHTLQLIKEHDGL